MSYGLYRKAKPAKAVVVHSEPLVVHSTSVVVHSQSQPKNGSSRHGRYANTERRRAYRREWMRRKRAAAKSALSAAINQPTKA